MSKRKQPKGARDANLFVGHLETPTVTDDDSADRAAEAELPKPLDADQGLASFAPSPPSTEGRDDVAGDEDAAESRVRSEFDAAGLLIDTEDFDSAMTVNLVGGLPLSDREHRDQRDAPTVSASAETMMEVDNLLAQRKHLRGLVEALVFASDSPITLAELAKLASAQQKQVRAHLAELKVDYEPRGIHLDEVAGGWVFRTSPEYAPFVRDLTKQKPVRLTRAQVETLAIIAYRQPITRPEVDDVRGVDSGPVVKLLLERDLVRILGKRDEPGRPLIYGTTVQFLEFFGLKSLKDLPTLREFTELSEESREAFEEELGEPAAGAAARAAGDGDEIEGLNEELEGGAFGKEESPSERLMEPTSEELD